MNTKEKKRGEQKGKKQEKGEGRNGASQKRTLFQESKQRNIIGQKRENREPKK